MKQGLRQGMVCVVEDIDEAKEVSLIDPDESV